MFYSWKADVFIHRLWNSVYDRWISSNFLYKWHITAAQQVAAIPRRVRFSTEIPLERERRLEIQREQRRRRRQQEIAEQREHRLAQRRQRRQQATEEQRNRRLECPRHSGWISLPLFFLRCTFEFILNTTPQGSNSVNGRERQFNAIYFKFQTVQRTHGPVVWGVKTGTTQGGVTCRMCGRAAETLPRVLLGCSALVQSKYLNRNNAALKMLFFEKTEVDRRVSVLTEWRVRVRIPWKQIFRNLIFFYLSSA